MPRPGRRLDLASGLNRRPPPQYRLDLAQQILCIVGRCLAAGDWALGVAPQVGFWGTAARGGGTFTLLCQVGLTLLLALRLEDEAQWRRLCFATLVGGVLVALYVFGRILGAF